MDIQDVNEAAIQDGQTKDYVPGVSRSYRYYRPHSEQVMIDRILRQKPAATEIVYEFTKDPGLLHQYYILRENMFINVWGLKGFSGREDLHDRYSQILVAREGNQCVGGVRITLKQQRSLRKLPMENHDFILEKVLPELKLSECRYAENSRFAVLPEARSKTLSLAITSNQIQKCLELGIQYSFAMSPVSLARSYKSLAKVFGLDAKILSDVEIPDREEFEGIPMVLTMFDFTTMQKRVDKSKDGVSEWVE